MDDKKKNTDNLINPYKFTVNKEFSKRGLIKVELDAKSKQVAFTRKAEINDLGWASLPLFNDEIIHRANILNMIDLYLTSEDMRSIRHIKFKKVHPLIYSPFTSLNAMSSGSLKACETLVCHYGYLEIKDLTTEHDDEYVNMAEIEKFVCVGD